MSAAPTARCSRPSCAHIHTCDLLHVITSAPRILAGRSGARLLVLDFVVPPGDTPHLATISDLSMLAMMGGKERTESEWRELLTTTGFADIEVRPTGTPFASSRQRPPHAQIRPF